MVRLDQEFQPHGQGGLGIVAQLDWEFWPCGEVGLGIPTPWPGWIRNSSQLLLLSFPLPTERIPGLGWGRGFGVLRFPSLDLGSGYRSQKIPCLQLGGIWDHPKSIPKWTKSFGIYSLRLPNSPRPAAPRCRFPVESSGNLGSWLHPGNLPRNVAWQQVWEGKIPKFSGGKNPKWNIFSLFSIPGNGGISVGWDWAAPAPSQPFQILDFPLEKRLPFVPSS